MRVWKLINNKDKLINTLLVGNNLVNISLSSIITVIAVNLSGSAGVGIATLVSTVLLLVFGEISPKTVATHHPEKIAFFFSGFIMVMEIVLTPAVFIFTGITSFALKLFKIDTKKKSVSFTEDEIKTFIDVGTEQGVIEKNEKTMMHRAFKFTDLAAKDVMIVRKNIKAIQLGSKYNEVVELSERLRLSRFPVYKKDIDDIVGILYVKDLLSYKNKQAEFSVEKVMRPPLFILETKKMSSIQQMLRENRQSMAVVIDEYSGTEGVLTSEDIAREIFGPISDEYKNYARKTEVQIKNKTSDEVDGLIRLVDLNEQLGIKIESRFAETLGGYILEQLDCIPEPGNSISSNGYRFTVTKMDEHRIAKVLFRELKEEE